MFSLNGFNIKRFVLFLGMHCHWLKCHAEVLSISVQWLSNSVLHEQENSLFLIADFS